MSVSLHRLPPALLRFFPDRARLGFRGVKTVLQKEDTAQAKAWELKRGGAKAKRPQQPEEGPRGTEDRCRVWGPWACRDAASLAIPAHGRKQELMQSQALALGPSTPQRGIVHGQWAWPAGKPSRGICLSGDVPKGLAGSSRERSRNTSPTGIQSFWCVCKHSRTANALHLVLLVKKQEEETSQGLATYSVTSGHLLSLSCPLQMETGFNNGHPSAKPQFHASRPKPGSKDNSPDDIKNHVGVATASSAKLKSLGKDSVAVKRVRSGLDDRAQVPKPESPVM